MLAIFAYLGFGTGLAANKITQFSEELPTRRFYPFTKRAARGVLRCETARLKNIFEPCFFTFGKFQEAIKIGPFVRRQQHSNL